MPWITLYEYRVRRQDGAIATVVAPNIEQVWETLNWNSCLCSYDVIRDMPGLIVDEHYPRWENAAHDYEVRTNQ